MKSSKKTRTNWFLLVVVINQRRKNQKKIEYQSMIFFCWFGVGHSGHTRKAQFYFHFIFLHFIFFFFGQHFYIEGGGYSFSLVWFFFWERFQIVCCVSNVVHWFQVYYHNNNYDCSRILMCFFFLLLEKNENHHFVYLQSSMISVFLFLFWLKKMISPFLFENIIMKIVKFTTTTTTISRCVPVLNIYFFLFLK